jgi:putative ABC transport system permease protein
VTSAAWTGRGADGCYLTSRLNPRDLFRTGTVGLRSRRLRASLSALGVSIGIAAIVGVLGISQSSKSGLLAELGRLGNLLTVQPGQSLFGQNALLPTSSRGMVARVGPVTDVTATGKIANVAVYRNQHIPTVQTGGIGVQAADPGLLATLGAKVGRGTFLNNATIKYPAVVLGSAAAGSLGIDRLDVPIQVWLGGRWFTVVGILDPVALAPEIDRSALIGFRVAESLLGFDGHPTELYVRAVASQVAAVRAVLAQTVNPANPDQVQVSRPSDVLAAQAAAKGAYNGLFLGLGAVALLVGGVGIANVMVISVLERRSEIGLRRALGATRRHVGQQFLSESLLLSLLGGLAGTVLGVGATAAYATSQHWSIVLPPLALYGGLGATVAIGVVAGLYPALRAARLSPADALRTV